MICPGIRIDGLALVLDGESIFADLTLDIPGGRWAALLGPSGVGKSSLLRILAGLAAPSAGTVTAGDGRPLAGRVAYMAQQDLLYPWLDALGNVTLGARLRGTRPDKARAMDLLARVGLADRARSLPAALSGGMRQRTALARTLYEDKPIVLMDEPFSALDAITRTRIQDLAAELLAERTVLLVTHDPLEACRLGHSLVVMSGHPPRLGMPITVSGTAPRAPDDPDLLATQGRLLRVLSGLTE